MHPLKELADKLGGDEPLSFDEVVQIWAEVQNKNNPNLDKGTQQTSWPHSGGWNRGRLEEAMRENEWTDDVLREEATRRGLLIQPIGFHELGPVEAIEDIAAHTQWAAKELLRKKALIDHTEEYPAHRTRHKRRNAGKDPRVN